MINIIQIFKYLIIINFKFHQINIFFYYFYSFFSPTLFINQTYHKYFIRFLPNLCLSLLKSLKWILNKGHFLKSWKLTQELTKCVETNLRNYDQWSTTYLPNIKYCMSNTHAHVNTHKVHAITKSFLNWLLWHISQQWRGTSLFLSFTLHLLALKKCT